MGGTCEYPCEIGEYPTGDHFLFLKTFLPCARLKLLLAAGSIVATLGGGEVSDADRIGKGMGFPHNLGGLSEGEGHSPTTTAGELSVWTFTDPRRAVAESFSGKSHMEGGITLSFRGIADNLGGLNV